MKSKSPRNSGPGRPKTYSETVNLKMVSVFTAAKMKGVSRQAVWLALGDSRLNGVCSNGVWMIYIDSKFTEWNPNRSRKNRT